MATSFARASPLNSSPFRPEFGALTASIPICCKLYCHLRLSKTSFYILTTCKVLNFQSIMGFNQFLTDLERKNDFTIFWQK